MRTTRSRSAAGFTLIELLIVVVIILVVAAMAIPNVLAGIDNVRLRSAASNVSGLMQSARQLAIRDNRFYTCRGMVFQGARIAYIDSLPRGAVRADGCGNDTYDPPAGGVLGEQVAQLPGNIQFDPSGANPAFPLALVGAGFTPQPATTMPTFNSRGLPCMMNGAACTTTSPGGAVPPNRPVSFLYYLRMDGASGTKWAAISVTPAGRVRVWTWSGSAWN